MTQILKKMTTKEFAQKAIENGYTGKECKGWEWIEYNLHELDYIFQTDEYKKHTGMKYLCMPLILNEGGYEKIEEDALTTTWYLNNRKEHKKSEWEYKHKMINEGWTPLSDEIVKQAKAENKKILVNASFQQDWLSSKIEKTYKPFLSADKIHYGLMELRGKTRCYSLHQFENAFCKLV